jgi:signal transduction histidine kinase
VAADGRGDVSAAAPIRLLVVDDDPDLVVQVRLLLRAARTPYLVEGHDIDAPLGERLLTGGIDACLLDHFLWDRQGTDLLRDLPRDAGLPPVVVLTGATDPALADVYLELGAADFLAKDEINPGMLDRAIRYAIRHSAARRDIAQSHLALMRSERLATIGALAAGMAHEYNNLNAVILGGLEAIASTHPALAPQLEPIMQALERSRRISLALLQLGRPRPATRPLSDLRLQVSITIGLLDGEAWRAGVVLASALGEGALTVQMDANDVHQVVSNLIVNGIHALWRHPRPRIEVTLRQEEGQAVLEVADNGVGIADDDLPQVFEPFFSRKGVQGHERAFPHGIEGSGLGLAVCAALVEQAGGAIAIASSLGTGTTVTVRLPVCDGPPAARAFPGAIDAPPASVVPSGARIAVVDDNKVLLELVSESLASLGYSISAFSDPAVFLQAAVTCSWDALVLDWQMPRYSGGDVLALLADPARRPPLPVLVISGTVPELPEPIPGVAVVEVLAKPFRTRSLVEALARMAARR